MLAIPEKARRPVAVLSILVILLVAGWWFVRPWYLQKRQERLIRVTLLGMTDVMGHELTEQIRRTPTIFNFESLSQTNSPAQVLFLIPAVGEPPQIPEHLTKESQQVIAALARRGIHSVAISPARYDVDARSFVAGATAAGLREHPDAKLAILYRGLPPQPEELTSFGQPDRQCYALMAFGRQLKPFLTAGLVQWAVVFRYSGEPKNVPPDRECFDPAWEVVTAKDVARLP